MADGSIILTDDATNTGKSLDHELVTYGVAPLSRYRPRVVLGGNIPAELARVVAAQPAAADYGLVVRQVGIAPAAAIGDAEANPTVTEMEVYPMTFNGTTWDRNRSGNAYSTTGLGVPLVNPNGMQKRTYVAAVRSAPAAFVAATPKDIFTLLHPAASAIVGRLRRVVVSIESTTVAGYIGFEIFRITTQGTGTAYTPQGTDPADAATIHTGAHTLTANATAAGNALANQAVYAAINALVPPIILYDWQESGETKAPIMRASTAEGYCIRVTPGAATTAVFRVQITYTED
jgi:hypothetical protein